MRIETQNTAASYTALCWITGSAGFTDAGDPNAVAPAAARIIRTPPGIFVTPGTSAAAFSADGTSAVVRFWWYDDVQLIWVANGTTATLTTASTNASSSVIGCMPGAKLFLQVTTNTLVTKIAFLVR